jgi:GNAT superfamily N-acetyltransferase
VSTFDRPLFELSGILGVMSDSDRRLIVGGSNPQLHERLSRELAAFNVAASGDDTQRGLSVEARLEGGGLTGWTWGTCAGVETLWVAEAQRGDGWGSRLLAAAEEAAKSRGCVQVLVSSFTFQAPEFYRRLGYVELARSEGLPTVGHADVHFRKRLVE